MGCFVFIVTTSHTDQGAACYFRKDLIDGEPRGASRTVLSTTSSMAIPARRYPTRFAHVHSTGPHRLVVRTSRRGRDNPGSTPGAVISRKRLLPPRDQPLSNVARRLLSNAAGTLGVQSQTHAGVSRGIPAMVQRR